MSTQYFSGQGKVWGAVRAGAVPGGFKEFGNCSSLVLRLGKNYANYAVEGTETPSKAVRSGDMPSFSLTMEELSGDNLARVLYGVNTTVPAAGATNETVLVTVGTSTPLVHMNLVSFISLKNSDLSVTYSQGTDYTVDLDNGMLSFPVGSTCGSTCKASYTYAQHTKVGLGTMAPPFMWLRFHGLNTAENNDPVVVDLYKVRLYPLEELPLIGDSFAQMQITGRLFYDTDMANTTTDGRILRIRKP